MEDSKPHFSGKSWSEASQSESQSKLETRSASPSLLKDPYLVDWEGPDDPAKPQNWTVRRKVIEMIPVLALTFLAPMSASLFSPGVPQVLREFHVHSAMLSTFVVSVNILGFALGPLLIGPLSELYGRWPVYFVCNVMYIVFTIASAVSQSMTQLIVTRLLGGCFGACPVTLGGATISDLFIVETRGVAVTFYVMGDLLGPIVAPILGGYISAHASWRWLCWVLAIAYGMASIAFAIFSHETYPPVLLARKAAKIRETTGDPNYRSAQDDGLPKSQRIALAWARPLRMLMFSPIAAFIALYVAVEYAILILLYATFTFVFEYVYRFKPSDVGYTYLGVGIGMLIGLGVVGSTSDRLMKRLAETRGGGKLKPEFRLIPLMFLGFMCPIGLFIYGWTAQYHIQWAVPLFGTLIFGLGTISVLICCQQYLIDAFPSYEASALAGNTVLRSIAGGTLPLCALSMYNKMGLGWGNSLLAFASLALLPIPFVFFAYSDRLRGNFRM